jgi:hypothetical protein
METAVVMTVTLSTVAIAWTRMDAPRMSARATAAAEQVSCHTVETALAAYATDHGIPAATLTDIRPYVHGDISSYRIDRGHAAGPGCAAPPD